MAGTRNYFPVDISRATEIASGNECNKE